MFLRPLIIDQDGNIIEGEARWAQAKAKGHTTIPGLVYELNKEQSLRLLLELATPHDKLNEYCRVALADTLALAYTRRAEKTDSIALEAESAPSNSPMKEVGREVLREMAKLAGVSIGTYRNARFVREHGIPRLHEYVRADKISIHRAYSIGQVAEFQRTNELPARAFGADTIAASQPERYLHPRGMGYGVWGMGYGVWGLRRPGDHYECKASCGVEPDGRFTPDGLAELCGDADQDPVEAVPG
jgi:hypothetical protein